MATPSSIGTLSFHRITIDDCRAIQAVTLAAGRRNCNFTISNLVCWQFLLQTEVCLLPGVALFSYRFDDSPSYFISATQLPDATIIEALRSHAANEGAPLRLVAVEDHWAGELVERYPDATVEPMRDSYDYIYRREHLEALQGKELKAKRNHVNRFLADHPDYHYAELTPDLFGQCLELEHHWRTSTHHDNPWYANTLDSEHLMLHQLFDNWDQLPMQGGTIFVDGRLVAFSCGCPVTGDTFDVCIEKADRNVDGAFNIINQQFVRHLPPQYLFINREEDMGLEGLRKAKLSYHPYMLLSYNAITIPLP